MTLLPLFPLPNVVLFPGCLLPLHIFEPRYRAMVADALESDRLIGMVLLKPGRNSDDGVSPIHGIGCTGVIVHTLRHDDGRYNIVLRGLDRFRIIEENTDLAYRRAAVHLMPELPLDDAEREVFRELRGRLDARLALPPDGSAERAHVQAQQLTALPDAELVNTMSQHLELEPIEMQALLERDTLRERAEVLLELLDMRRLSVSMPRGPNVTH